MSTRATVIVKDSYEKIYFYRHSDGYPEGALPSLRKFMKWVIEGKIRNNPSQSAGWLVMLGARETDKMYVKDPVTGEYGYVPKVDITEPSPDKTGYEWKVGNYEPASNKLPGDIEWLYELDVEKKTISFVPAVEGKTADQLLKSRSKRVITETEITNPSVSDEDFGELYKAPEPDDGEETEEGDACGICGNRCLELEEGPSGEEKVCCVCRDRPREAMCGPCSRSDDDEEEEFDAPGELWSAGTKVGIKPKTKFKEWYQEEAWNTVLSSLKERFAIDEKDIIYVHFVENTTRRFAYYLLVVFKKDGKYLAGPLFGKYGHAPNMESMEEFDTAAEARNFAGDKISTKETKRGYTPVTVFQREQYAAVESNAGLIAGVALIAGALGYFLLRRK